MPEGRKIKKHVLEAVLSAKQIIDNNPAEKKTVYTIARQHGISRNALQRAFKEMYGSGIRSYRLKAKMELSKKNLSTGMDAKQASITVRYSTPSAFNNAFKKYFKVTPKQMNDSSDQPNES